ncbi:protein CROWDED NUCLEI 3-like [Vicia villosa]|uniref:protein CROWDED NUCLEI 3-like n=1 Tax=Vicia villosa TaxID=3911 RepID=UPI00273B1674|nr:protein CROWDED NUCLEI 3-like [Vicia villosa]
MFTPQRKARPTSATTTFTPHRVGSTPGSGLTPSAKGKAVVIADEPLPPPPLGSLTEARDEVMVASGLDAGYAEDWRKFREVGLLDEAVMQRKDQEALMEKLSRLEKELFDYQYNMGLLLIEKQEWSSKFDRLRQELAETEEVLKREQSSHLIALSEVGKREENLKKALSLEKQCGSDLERALCAMQEELAQVKSSSHTKLDEANALVDGIEEKSSTVNKKLYDAEARLAEVNRKNTELDMKLREVEVRESLLQKERLSVATDRESFETVFYKQREDLKEWERKLRQREDMLCDGRQNIGEKENNVTVMERNLKQKARDLEVLETNIDSANSILKEKEAEISRRVSDVDAEEKKVDSMKKILEVKEKELHALELKLSVKEREGIQKLLDEQKDTLDLKLQQFELEMKQKRKYLAEEFSIQEGALENREIEVNHMETKVRKEEMALSKKSERIKEQNKELETKLKSLKEKEKTMKIKEKELEKEKEHLLAERESLENLNVELGKIRAEISQQELRICQDTENLKLTEDERSEHSRLQLELKQEIEHTRTQKDFIMKEAENLREERIRFEKEWEELDKKRSEISGEQQKIDKEKERLRKLKNSEEERLKREKQDMQDHLKKELEKLELDKESFNDSITQEKFLLSEKIKNEKAQMLEDFEWKTRNLENEIQKRKEEMEKNLQERERRFQEEMERELNNIDTLKDAAEKEWEEVKSEGTRLENERKELETNKQQLKSDQHEMHQDSEMLMNLSQKVRKERERLVAERNHFIALVEKLRNCQDCGEVVRDVVVSDLHLPDNKEIDVLPLPPSPVLNDTQLKNFEDNVIASGSNYSGSTRPVSWLRKCTSKIFKLSPSTKTDSVGTSYMGGTSPESDVNVNIEKVKEPTAPPNIEGPVINVPEQQIAGGAALPSSDTPHFQSDNIVREVNNEYSLSMDDNSYMESLIGGDPDDSQQSVPKVGRKKPGRKSKSGIARTRSVKAVVEEAKEFLGKSSKENVSLQSHDTDHIKENSLEESGHTEKVIGRRSRKRQHAQTSRIVESEQNTADSEGQSDSITTSRRKKKRETVPPSPQVTRETRYNLRRHKTADTVSSAQDLTNGSKNLEKEDSDSKQKAGDENLKAAVADDNIQTTTLVQVSTVKSVEVKDDRVVRFEIPTYIIDGNGATTNSVDHVEESGTLEYGDEDGSIINDIENEDEGEEEEEEGEEEEEEEDASKVSIGKKLFKFFTT